MNEPAPGLILKCLPKRAFTIGFRSSTDKMQDSESERKARLRELASKLFFSLEEQSSGYSLYRDVDVKNPVRHEALTLDEAEHILNTWKLRGLHGG